MATQHPEPARHGLSELFDASPAAEARTSAAAVLAFVAAVGALLTAPFSTTFALSFGLACLGVLAGLVGLVVTSRPDRTGSALAPWALVGSLIALALLGLRYTGLDTAFGDRLAPGLLALLRNANAALAP